MRRSYMIAAVLAGAAALYMATGLISPNKAAQENARLGGGTNAHEDEIKVAVRHFSAASRERTLILRGKTMANRVLELRAQTAGVIAEVRVNKGETVSAGQVIATLQNADRQAKLAETRALQQQRQIESHATSSLNKKGFSSTMDVASAQAQLSLANAEVKAMEVELDRLSIRAPGAGIVDDRPAEPGKYFGVGEEIARIVDLDPILIVGFASEKDVTAIRQGDQASIRLLDGSTHQGRISFIAAAADDKTHTFRVDVTLPNADRALRQGLSAEIALPVQTEKIQIIPAQALSLDGSGQLGVKYLDPHGMVQAVPAEVIGEDRNGLWLAGLPDELDVIVAGQEFVKTGQRATAIKATD
ncbi:MAG TPA: efflux RND transporter periplasmic adaptor subunit [Dongiaceae bacterium]|nr:efflux RND transporter periplasmic adaptor subunit [Dongiaceae bacterium]